MYDSFANHFIFYRGKTWADMKMSVWVLADEERKSALVRVLEVHCETLKNRGSIKSHWPREVFSFLFRDDVRKRMFLGEVTK